MQLTPELQKRINEMGFEEALWLNRYEQIGSPWFMGKVGEAMMARLSHLKKIVPHEEQVAASKRVGWDR